MPELVCAYSHVDPTDCTQEVTHILTRHDVDKPICAAAAKTQNANLGQPCMKCRRPKWTHWDVTPIAQIEAYRIQALTLNTAS